MADHFDIAERKLTLAHDTSSAIAAELASPDPDRGTVQRLANSKRSLVAEAKAHADLAIAQSLDELHNLLDDRLRRS